jgi:iron-sulfur cluster assembly protein
MGLSLTEKAATHVRAMLAQRAGAQALRVGIKPSGCSGFGYVVDYADGVDETDTVFEQHGVKVVVDRKSLPFLNDIEIDFVREGLNQRFDFRNPNAKATCGCGESFAV